MRSLVWNAEEGRVRAVLRLAGQLVGLLAAVMLLGFVVAFVAIPLGLVGTQPAASRTPRTTLLLVEDDDDLASVLTAMFQRDGLTTVRARTGREALELCERITPDLVVLDIGLPDVDGFAVVDELGRLDRLREATLVVYTGRDLSAAERQRLTDEGALLFTKGTATPEAFEQRVLGLVDRLAAAGVGSGP